MFNWVVPLMGGDIGVRFWHHLFLWFFVTFVIVHIYLSFYHDYIEGRGTVSSIIGGWKFDRVTTSDEDESAREACNEDAGARPGQRHHGR